MISEKFDGFLLVIVLGLGRIFNYLGFRKLVIFKCI